MKTPVAVFVYNRPERAAEVLDSLNRTIGAEETDIFIFSDGPKNAEDCIKVEKTRQKVRMFEKEHAFRSVYVKEQNRNIGLAKSIISGVSEIIRKTGSIIVVEDDMVVQKGLLNFLNDALVYYKKDDKIWSISGHTIYMEALKNYKDDVYFGYRGASYIWATWEDRWNKCDWGMRDYKYFKFNPILRHMFNRGGADMANMLDVQMLGMINSWAIRWNFFQFKYNMLTVFPQKTLAECKGYDGTGTNCKYMETVIEQELWEKQKNFVFRNVVMDKRIVLEFRRFYSGNIVTRIKCKISAFILLMTHLYIYNDGSGLKISTVKKMKKY